MTTIAENPMSASEVDEDPQPPARPVRRVLIVDDELVGLTYSHLADLSDNVVGLFADLNSPEVEELWTMVMHIKGFPGLDKEAPVKVLAYMTSDALVQEVLLSKNFRTKATARLTGPLENFLQRADLVATLKSQLEAAFPSPEYQTTFVAARPSAPADLLQYDLVILDLVLRKSAGAVDEVVSYLMTMGNVTYPQRLPCIIVMSSRDELIQERLRFSTESNISAAGLLLLPKVEISREYFGAPGLVLSYQQLDRQRDISQHMRVFMRTWMEALEKAREQASVSLWNLDAAAMQEIHLSAFHDNDPYDEHLNELMAREYMWHVESSPDVSMAIEALDGCFQEQFKNESNPAVIGQRFIAPFVKPMVGRALVSHFTWTGFSVPQTLDSMTLDEASKRFNRLMPFGALLAPKELSPATECFIHITQQCDLNSATRPGNSEQPLQAMQTVLFAVVLPIEVEDHRIPSHETHELVARGLTVDGKEYDFKLAKGRQLAMSITKFIEHANREGLRVVGRLRHDIATHFLTATANHITRPASLKTTRVEVRNAKLFLYGKKFPEGKPIPFLDMETKEPSVVQVAKHNKLHFFQDHHSMLIALWIRQQLATHYEQEIDAAQTCNALSVGLNNKQGLVKLVDFVSKSFPLTEIDKYLPPEMAPDMRVHLVVVDDPSVG